MKNKNKYKQFCQQSRRGQRQLLRKTFNFFNFKNGWRIGLGVVTLCLVLAYLFQVNCLAITGFEIRELERDIYVLQETNKQLNLEVTQLQSIHSLEKVSQDLAMIDIDDAEYITPVLSSVALNK